MFTIYALSDPRRPSLPRYVGQTKTALALRLYHHLARARRGNRTPVSRWIRLLKSRGREPIILPLRTAATQTAAYEVERQLIRHWRKSLKNLAEGGPGRRGGRVPRATRLKMARAQRRLWRDPDVRAKRSVGISIAKKGRVVISAKQRRQIAASLRRHFRLHPQSAATKKKRVRSHLRTYKDPAVRRRHSDAIRRALNRPEVRRKLRCAARRRLKDPSYVRAHSVGMKAAWARGAWARRKRSRR